MLILVPVDDTSGMQAKISTLAEVKQWALIDFDEGVGRSVRFFDDRMETGESWIEFVILKSTFENYMPFMEENMMVLAVREEETLEEIIEAFKFKELDEVGF